MADPASDMAQAQGVQPVDYRPGPGGQQIPVYSQASPGIGGAIMDAIRALAGALGPKSITQAPARMKQQEQQAGSLPPPAGGLGDQF
jgi:hypothetical protein